MEGNRRITKGREDLLAKIRDFTCSLVRNLSEGRSLAVFIDKFRNYCTNPDANWLVMGWLRFLEAERKFDCMNFPSNVHPIPVHVDEVKDIVSVAKYILVVENQVNLLIYGDLVLKEKQVILFSECLYLPEHLFGFLEAVFQRLANDHFCNANRCIVITIRGELKPCYSDATCKGKYHNGGRIRNLKDILIPVLLCNSLILLDYMCLKSDILFHERLELESMLQRVKFEIEALSVRSLSFLSEQYIPSKIQGGLHI
ncbi:hypothetical protein GH714_023118 [Hevea brasiliensis]|uniref:Topoisomerase 6 subunit A/Spo11 TOPRIM domain-containing protein n=1 Tax=Hevea brasiliensis TaxID=3981 RepID=A0A6A6KJ45_HEVBR|nr:hypothetical protein GH714_023118 [Hevea brasiliensis]